MAIIVLTSLLIVSNIFWFIEIRRCEEKLYTREKTNEMLWKELEKLRKR